MFANAQDYGRRTDNEYTNFKNATTSEGKLETLKMQRITVTDKAGNTVSRDVYAILSHRIECYIGTEKQIIDRENARDYLEVINGSNLKLTYLHENASAALGYQNFYYVTVNGTHTRICENDATHIESDDCFDGDNDHCCDACGNAVSTHSGGTATCSERAKCELCGERYGELNPNNHADLKRVSEKTATTEADGNIEYWYCSECNRYFSDSQATREISQSDTVIAKLSKPVESSELPKTGSGSKLARWVWLSLASGGALGLTAAFERKKRKKN